MMPGESGVPYRFASQAEIDAVTAGTGAGSLPADTEAATAERIEAARAAGATAVCETYLYIGNLPNFYTGGDVALYDFYIAVETDLETGAQTVYASIPSDAVPAFRADVTLDSNGSATMALEDVDSVSPVRLVFEVAPRDEVRELLERVRSEETLTQTELAEALGDVGVENVEGDLAVTALAYEGADGATTPGMPVATVLTGQAASGSAYVVSSDAPLYTLAARTEVAQDELPEAENLVPLTSEPVTGHTYYYLETTYTARFSSASEAAPATATQTVRRYVVGGNTGDAAWRVGADGQYELIAGTPAMPTGTVAVTNAKAENATGTLPYVQELRGDMSEGALVLTAKLGNNGAYVFEVEDEEPAPDPDPGTDPDPDPGTGEEPGGDGTTQPGGDESGDHGGTGGGSDSGDKPGQDGSSDESSDDQTSDADGSEHDGDPLAGTGETPVAGIILALIACGGAACLAGVALMHRKNLKR